MKKLTIILAICLSGCTTIHFDNGTVLDGQTDTAKWHHIGILNLVELSSPVNLKNECGKNKWTSVKTENSFLNALAANIVNSVVAGAYSPKSVEITCKHPTLSSG